MTVTGIFALLGAKALYLLLAWLASAIIASWLSFRAGYGERAGLATGLLLTVAAIPIWLVIYIAIPRPGSRRSADGVIPKRRKAAEIDIDSRPTA